MSSPWDEEPVARGRSGSKSLMWVIILGCVAVVLCSASALVGGVVLGAAVFNGGSPVFIENGMDAAEEQDHIFGRQPPDAPDIMPTIPPPPGMILTPTPVPADIGFTPTPVPADSATATPLPAAP